jgi:hypothetical protein
MISELFFKGSFRKLVAITIGITNKTNEWY